ncbi:hypothetical protein LOZ61_006123 [Ophidiomyces ophidiicola]|nr:hypothetical protein LOZ61_006123 [Ophidiomyces ophidiicola]KAI1922477.1 hypothetical protein LOZ60_005648 [Ophidiomyces ophidiicola]KAI1968982.1 hypothetical protein LOZ56_004664 [Ophidiomyces ophidiicola]KAI2008300.1 hypothetical protein LOZ49_004295 [Ophidiomyces ophidiicola]KAI2012772.1 hypothetical protein LOZ46_006001 [Ophidiomyces ophidiicola]
MAADFKEPEIDYFTYVEGNETGLECPQNYCPGGLHPVHLGDCLGEDGRYRALHKLGSGGFAVVWLCRDLQHDTPRYVAVKIVMAMESTDKCPELHAMKLKQLGVDQEIGGSSLCLPSNYFWIQGPNGGHLCLVYPVAGPSVSKIARDASSSRAISRQVVEGLAALHRHGFCHGDFTTSNILYQLTSLDGFTENQVIKTFGQPVSTRLLTESMTPPILPNTPKYLVYPIDFTKVESSLIMDKVYIIDFGQCYEALNPPKSLGTPARYCPLELLLDNKISGTPCDLWALGCTLFQICTTWKLFDTFEDNLDDRLYEIVLLRGKLPEPWWTSWKSRSQHFTDEVDSSGCPERANKMTRRKRFRSLQEQLLYGGNGAHPVPVDEVEALADLVGRLLAYNPWDRPSAETIQKHKWFKMDCISNN